MGEAENRQTVERIFQALTEGQVELFHAQFHEDSVIEFPQSGERIAGGESRRAVYRAFPGRPRVRRIVTGGDLAVVEAAVDYGDGVDWSAVFIYELRDGKIARATALGSAVRGRHLASGMGPAYGWLSHPTDVAADHYQFGKRPEQFRTSPEALRARSNTSDVKCRD